MKKVVHRAETRGYVEHGWLKTYHTFSFASYHNPERIHFGRLRVLNDDWIAPGQGFGTHPHDNMEIVTVPLEGSLRHRDSMGHEYALSKGEVQRMSAGTGITHSEFNNSQDEAVSLLQIWVLPKEKNIQPSYEQKKFDLSGRQGRFQFVVAPDRRDGALGINQDAYFSLCCLPANYSVEYNLNIPTNGVYFFLISGEAKIQDETLKSRDAMGVSGVKVIPISSSADAEILAIEVPMV